jgi:hypothetical protein
MSALPPKADIGTGPDNHLRRNNSGSLAILAAILRASHIGASKQLFGLKAQDFIDPT